MTHTLYRKEIEAAALTHAIDPDLLEALVLTESSGQTDAFRFEAGFFQLYLKDKPLYAKENPRRVSSSYGLCQIMYPVAVELGYTGAPEGLFAPEMSLNYGAKKLASLLKWSGGDVTKALGGYNAGHGGWDSAPGRSYAASVQKTLADLKAMPA